MLEQDFDLALRDTAALPHKRFSIYRHNVSAALSGALRVRFPVVEQLVGSDFFGAMAADYVAGNKPLSAVLIHYGASFAEFIESYEAANALPYLADVARFENVWWQAYHAADGVGFDVQKLSAIAADEWGELKFTFKSDVGLFKNEQGAVSIWQWHQISNNTAELVAGGAEYAVVSRPSMDVEVRLLSAETFVFLQLLAMGKTLEDAVGETTAQFSQFDLQQHLSELFQLNLIKGISK